MNCEAIHCFDTATVRFAVYPDGFDGPRILAEITEEALRDVFGARDGPEGLLRACEGYFETIGAIALRRHRLDPTHAVELETKDFAVPSALAAADAGDMPHAARRNDPAEAPESAG